MVGGEFGDGAGEPVRQPGINLDRGDLFAGGHKPQSERPQPRAHLKNMPVSDVHELGGRDNHADRIGVMQEVLAQLFRGGNVEFAGECADISRSQQTCSSHG